MRERPRYPHLSPIGLRVTTRTRSRRILLLAGAATALVALLLGLQAWQESRSAGRRIGIYLETDRDEITVQSVIEGEPADLAGFQPGDLIVAIDDVPTPTVADYDPAAVHLRRARAADFEIVRNDRNLVLRVHPGTAFPWTSFLLNLATTLAYLSLGALALSQSPSDRRAQLLFAFSAAVSVELALPLRLELVPHWALLTTLFYDLLSGLQMSLELHLASVIPVRYEWFQRRRWLPGAYYVVGLGLGVLTSASVLLERLGLSLLPFSGEQAQSFFYQWGLSFWAAAVVAILVAQLRNTDSARHHAQAMLVLLGVAPWALFTWFLHVAGAIALTLPPWVITVESLILITYPVAVFVAIFRYKLLDIEVVVKRSLVFALVTAVMIAVFYLAFSFTTALFADRVESGSLSLAALSVSMLLLGLLFLPVRRTVQSLVDRRLFPERLAMRQRLTELAAELPAQGNLSAMGRHVVTQLCEVFGLASSTLLVADPSSGLLVTLASTTKDPDQHFGQSFLLEPDDPGVRTLQRAGRPLPADQVADRSRALAQRLHAFGAVTAVGLASGRSLTGVLLLGPKVTEDRLRSEETELLTLFSHMLATVLENVRLFESATFESLTGLLRREAILSALDRELHRARRYRRPLSIGMADIDRFKRVNDEYGHLAGDALLKQVAQVLKGGLRASDAIGRYGGEEFLFFLPETDLDGAVQVAEKLRQLVESLPDPVEGTEELTVTVSIGIAELDNDAEPEMTMRQIIANADANLLRAKREGRNRVVPHPVVAA